MQVFWLDPKICCAHEEKEKEKKRMFLTFDIYLHATQAVSKQWHADQICWFDPWDCDITLLGTAIVMPHLVTDDNVLPNINFHFHSIEQRGLTAWNTYTY